MKSTRQKDRPEVKFITDLSQWKMAGYITEVGDDIYISIIDSLELGKGNFSKFLEMLLKKYRYVKIPTPFPKMTEIAKHKGFAPTYEHSEELGEVEVWVKEGYK